jgi:hypothetical protein
MLAFPITLKPNGFPSYRGKFAPGTLDDAVWTCLKGLQPDVRTNPDLPAFLEILSILDNYDKHRLVSLAVASAEEYGIAYSGVIQGAGKMEEKVYYGNLYDGTEIHSITFERPTRNVKYDIVDLDMAFTIWHGAKQPDDPRLWMHRSNLLALLNALISEVKKVIAIVLASVPTP